VRAYKLFCLDETALRSGESKQSAISGRASRPRPIIDPRLETEGPWMWFCVKISFIGSRPEPHVALKTGLRSKSDVFTLLARMPRNSDFLIKPKKNTDDERS
jgi:hypothetical protein